MRVNHAADVRPETECPTYACTLAVERHERADDYGQVWHHDDGNGMHWPTDELESELLANETRPGVITWKFRL